MSTLGLGETLSDVSGVADVADVEMHDIQESGTASTSTKKELLQLISILLGVLMEDGIASNASKNLLKK
jgi:hypothetical protein